MSIATHLLAVLCGALFGVFLMAVLVMGKRMDEDESSETLSATDTERLDFLSRNNLGVNAIQHGAGPTMWAVVANTPIRTIGEVKYTPRDAIDSAAETLLAPEVGKAYAESA